MCNLCNYWYNFVQIFQCFRIYFNNINMFRFIYLSINACSSNPTAKINEYFVFVQELVHYFEKYQVPNLNTCFSKISNLGLIDCFQSELVSLFMYDQIFCFLCSSKLFWKLMKCKLYLCSFGNFHKHSTVCFDNTKVNVLL